MKAFYLILLLIQVFISEAQSNLLEYSFTDLKQADESLHNFSYFRFIKENGEFYSDSMCTRAVEIDSSGRYLMLDDTTIDIYNLNAFRKLSSNLSISLISENVVEKIIFEPGIYIKGSVGNEKFSPFHTYINFVSDYQIRTLGTYKVFCGTDYYSDDTVLVWLINSIKAELGTHYPEKYQANATLCEMGKCVPLEDSIRLYINLMQVNYVSRLCCAVSFDDIAHDKLSINEFGIVLKNKKQIENIVIPKATLLLSAENISNPEMNELKEMTYLFMIFKLLHDTRP